ncbi:MAG: substrate-binding domain-containing protein [bacterium]
MTGYKGLLVASCLFAVVSGSYAEVLTSTGREKEKELKFIFVTTCKDEAFFNPVKKGVADAARKMNVKCEWVGTEEVDLKEQAQMVKDAIAKGYDGIAVDMIDAKAFDEVATAAAAKGIPLVSFNTDDTTENARLSTVAQNLYHAGVTAGKIAATVIKPESQVLITEHSAGISALEDRARGMQDSLKDKNIKVTILITGTSAKDAAVKVAKALKDNPGISAVLSTGQADTEGAGVAVEKEFKDKGIYVGGFDLSSETLRLVESGVISFTIDQQPYIQGFYPVIQLALRCRYGIMPPSMDAGAAVITRANAAAVAGLVKKGYR